MFEWETRRRQIFWFSPPQTSRCLQFLFFVFELPWRKHLSPPSHLKVDNSSLTGEAEPQERVPKNIMENPLEATNLAFSGTLAVNGEAYGVVVRTGDHTVLGQIANLTSSESKRTSPLTEEIDFFVKIIAVIAIICALIFFGVGMARFPNISYNLNFAIGVFVSFVPEGLPVTMTVMNCAFLNANRFGRDKTA